MKSQFPQRQTAEHVGHLGQQILKLGGMSLGRIGHRAHSLKWYLEISHEDNDWEELMTGLVGSWRKPWSWQQRKKWKKLRTEN